MKKILTLVLIPAVLLALVSCGGSDTKTTDVLADSTSTTLPILNPSATNTNPVTTSTEPSSSTNGVVASPVTTSTAPVTAASGLNPAHGQPGHRCDISVGAPLNSKPTTTTTPSTPQIQTVTPQVQNVTVPTVSSSITPTVNSNPTVTAPGMNPAHGQPGHRCDISVGAPLNSKPTTTTSPITVQPATKDSTK